uniref:Innexin n=1 Tax=Elaeophora elaphi TaxID=1147741 RepID=A0A0R3RUM3_9BILA
MIQKFDKYLGSLKPKYDDDVVDRCNYLVTNIVLLICAITVAAKQYVGEPLQCWVPAEFQDSWEQYIENFCFIENTYFVPFEDDIPVIICIQMPQNVINTKYNIINGYRLFSSYKLCYFLCLGPSGQCLIGEQILIEPLEFVGLNMQAIVDAAMLTRKVGKKRLLKNRSENCEESLAQAQHIAYVMDYNRRKRQNQKLMGKHSFTYDK